MVFWKSSWPATMRDTSLVPPRTTSVSAPAIEEPRRASISKVSSPPTPKFLTVAPLRPPSRSSGCRRLGIAADVLLVEGQLPAVMLSPRQETVSAARAPVPPPSSKSSTAVMRQRSQRVVPHSSGRARSPRCQRRPMPPPPALSTGRPRRSSAISARRSSRPSASTSRARPGAAGAVDEEAADAGELGEPGTRGVVGAEPPRRRPPVAKPRRAQPVVGALGLRPDDQRPSRRAHQGRRDVRYPVVLASTVAVASSCRRRAATRTDRCRRRPRRSRPAASGRRRAPCRRDPPGRRGGQAETVTGGPQEAPSQPAARTSYDVGESPSSQARPSNAVLEAIGTGLTRRAPIGSGTLRSRSTPAAPSTTTTSSRRSPSGRPPVAAQPPSNSTSSSIVSPRRSGSRRRWPLGRRSQPRPSATSICSPRSPARGWSRVELAPPAGAREQEQREGVGKPLHHRRILAGRRRSLDGRATGLSVRMQGTGPLTAGDPGAS